MTLALVRRQYDQYDHWGGAMAQLLVRHKVRDYATWKPAFDEHESARRAAGGKSARVFRTAEDPNEVVLLMEWDSVENARRFAESDDLHKVMEKAGVVDRPDVFFLNEA
jgi:heme-degrading monooxygenase HmoA